MKKDLCLRLVLTSKRSQMDLHQNVSILLDLFNDPHGVGIFSDHDIGEFSNPMCRLSNGAWRGGVPRQTGKKSHKNSHLFPS